ncbi:MAG: hypothetical protein ACYTFW_12165 [Planctomycetota bacterium]
MLSIGALIDSAGVGGCCHNSADNLGKGGRVPEKTIAQVQQEHTGEWMAIPGVEGIAIGLFEDKPCIKIFSSRKAEELQDKIPSEVEGYPVIIEETGVFRALD